jgi:hypothetical protein
LEKDKINKDQVNSEVEEAKDQTLNTESTEIVSNAKEDMEVTSENETLLSDETKEKNLVGKLIVANALDQLIMIAGSAVLLFLIDLIMRKAFGYMFIRDNGALILAGGIIYFVVNCIYMPIMERTKMENTVAKKILNLN